MVNLRGETDYVDLDDKKQVAVEQDKVRLTYFVAVGNECKPGRPAKSIAGIGLTGCVVTANGDNAEELNLGIIELDKTLINDCTSGYTAGDVIPVIEYKFNRGLTCRNLSGIDPTLAININHPFTADASGFMVVIAKDTTGAVAPTKTLVRAERYYADPNAAFKFVGVIE